MTPKQLRVLEILDRHSGEGTMEVLLEYGDYDEDKSWQLTKLVVASLVNSLVKKGLATKDENGYGITERGRKVLARWKRK